MTIERRTDVSAASSVLVRRRSAMQRDDASPPLAGVEIGALSGHPLTEALPRRRICAGLDA
jgi:hypothetical protein